MFPRKNKTINRWAAFLALCFMLVFATIFGRFVFLAEAKEVDGHDLVKIGKNNWTQVKVVDAERGKILSRNGDVLARDVPAYDLYAVLSHKAPSYVKDKEKTARELAPILKMKETDILKILNKPLYQVEFGVHGQKLDADTMERIKNLHLPGIGFIRDSKRYYPNGTFASYVIGFTNHLDETDKEVGVLGIEKSLNSYLTEQDGLIKFYSDRNGDILPDGVKDLKKPKNGDDVYLTIDRRIQTVLEDAMDRVYEKYDPKRMIAIVCDPKTGAILAMSDRPTFDPNERNIQGYTNDAISTPYEPGSVMKTFTLAAAINEGVWPGTQTFKSGAYEVKDGRSTVATIHDWIRNWGTITFNDGFIRSSNVAFSIVEDKYLGPDRFYKYLERFGFTKKTGIDLPKEADSRINFKWHTDQVMNSFGQASAFTAIQIVQAATAIANDGKMMRPYIIQKVVDPNSGKTVLAHKPAVAGRPITKETAEKVRELMRKVVTDKNGTGTRYNLKGYDVIGKTGTAQISMNGQYLTGEDNYIFSFLGMAPKNDPKLVVYIAIDRPHLKPLQAGSEPVSEVFNPVMQNALQYLKVEPTQADATDHAAQKAVRIDDWTGKPVDEAVKALAGQGLHPVAIGNGTVRAQLPQPGVSVLPNTKILLLGTGEERMPDITGWSLSEVLQLSRLTGMETTVTGDGYVVSQKPAKGAAIGSGQVLDVKLERPSGAAAKDE